MWYQGKRDQLDDNGRIDRDEGVNQQAHQNVTECPARPRRTTQHPIIVLELGFATQAHHTQCHCHGAFAGRQNSSDNQHVGPRSGPFTKCDFKVPQHLYNCGRQVKYVTSHPFRLVRRVTSLPCRSYLVYEMDKVELRQMLPACDSWPVCHIEKHP
jgi:hypothetical protein